MSTDALQETSEVDLFREVHKGIRNEIFRVTVGAGATDPDDERAVAQLVADVTELAALLHVHAGHEDRHIEPLLQRHAPEIAADLAVAHDDSEAALNDLLAMARSMQAGGNQRTTLLAALYDRLADFAVSYLAHLRDEEGVAMPALASVLDDDALLAVQNSIRREVTPDDMCRFMRFMIPAMNRGERVAMLSDMQAAPPEIFASFRETARSVLSEDDWDEVAIGLA